MYQRGDGEGFTLIELLVSVVLLGVALLGVLALLPAGNAQVTSSARISTINHLGQKKLDYLRTLPFNHADLNPNARHPSLPETVPGLNGYTIAWYVDQDADMPTGMKQVTVEVGYQLYQPNSWTQILREATADQHIARFRAYISQ